MQHTQPKQSRAMWGGDPSWRMGQHHQKGEAGLPSSPGERPFVLYEKQNPFGSLLFLSAKEMALLCNNDIESRPAKRPRMENTERPSDQSADYVQWEPLLRRLDKDVTLLPSLWIQEVYWRLGLPNSEIYKCPNATSEIWDIVARRIKGFASTLYTFFYFKRSENMFDPKKNTKEWNILCLIHDFSKRERTREETMHCVYLLTSLFSDPQLVD